MRPANMDAVQTMWIRMGLLFLVVLVFLVQTTPCEAAESTHFRTLRRNPYWDRITKAAGDLATRAKRKGQELARGALETGRKVVEKGKEVLSNGIDAVKDAAQKFLGRLSPNFQPSQAFIQRSRRLAQYAMLAYCLPQHLKSWSCPGCKAAGQLSEVDALDTPGETQYYIGVNKQRSEIVLSFRGTSNLRNWLTDLDSLPSILHDKGGNVMVHRGFHASLQSVYQRVLAKAKELQRKYSSYRFYVTGHSLGGAIATIAAHDLFRAGIKNMYLYTFGSPRVGSATFASRMRQLFPTASREDGRSYRFVHHHDLVPHVPPSPLFHHIGREVWLNKDFSQFRICDGTGEDSSCSRQLKDAFSIADHLDYFGQPTCKDAIAMPSKTAWSHAKLDSKEHLQLA